ncbi:MAG: 50S ribosomal protein L30, partial [Phycisphaerae bacterium]
MRPGSAPRRRLQNQKRTLAALGLRGIGKEVIHDATPNILGMIKKVEHLVSVTEA